jgi:hypothetical protein
MIWRVAAAVVALILAYAGVEGVWHAVTASPPGRRTGPVTFATSSALPPAPVEPSGNRPAPITSQTLVAPRLGCASTESFAEAARQNTETLSAAAWDVFGRAERGWEIYAPLIQHEIDTACPVASDGFAEALGAWQIGHALAGSGVMDPATLKAMNLLWLRRRPFLAASGHGVCPPPPAPDQLTWASKEEGYSGKPIQLRPAALAAYRALVTAARAEEPTAAADHRLLTIFSGYRDPASDAANCARDHNCGTIAKANCSAHRTGLAMDIYLGAAEGYPPESSADPNRLYQSRTPAYRWLAANAGRFGFAPYPFEPWHWEWTGESP